MENTKATFKSKLTWIIVNNPFLFLIIIGIGVYFGIPRLVKGLTPVTILTGRIYEKSKYKFNGAICNDGWVSHSQGRGTCSWHDGVDYYFYKGDYKKSYEECREEAVALSWLE